MRHNEFTLALLCLLTFSSTAAANSPAQAVKAAPVASGSSPSPAPALHVLSDTPLGETLRLALDVRWASDHSVALAVLKSGVVEYNLDGKTPPRPLVPADKEPGRSEYGQEVAISSRYLAAGAWLQSVTWRPVGSAVRKEEAFDCLNDIDVSGSRAAVVGVRRDAQGKFSPDGAVAWIGSLDKNLSDLKPLLFDASGSGAPSMNACCGFHLGVTRFLADGSLVVAPGIQPGIHHFDSQGKLLKALDTVALGIDTDCAGIGKEMVSPMGRDPSLRMAWINQRRIVDDVLPLPAGPGLLIRSIQQGQVRWALKVLHSDGSVEIYDVPVKAPNLFAHLKGDFLGGRLVLLFWGNPSHRNPDGIPIPHLLIASLPTGD